MTDDAMRNTTLRPVTRERADELMRDLETAPSDDDVVLNMARARIRAILVGAFERVEATDAPP